jgi:His Kinase A (phospho-acceptor) domain
MMFEHGGSSGDRPSDPRAARDRGADDTAGGERAANGGVEPSGEPDGGRACDSLAASWPRLCHDLRTPLNGILGNAEVLLDGSAGPLSREARACIGDIQTAAGRMMRDVQALLELCRPELASDSCVDLLALLAAAEPLARTGPPIRFDPAGAVFIVRGDARWLRLLAGVLAELYLGEGLLRGPLHVSVEPPAHGGHALLRLWWANLHPDQMPALPLALTDAILDLHDGELSLSSRGLLLYWPLCRMAKPAIAPRAR